MTDDSRALGYKGNSIHLVTDIHVIHFRIDEEDEGIHFSEESYSEFIIGCTGANRDLDVDARELSSGDKKSDDELVFFSTTTKTGRRVMHPFASHSEWL